MALSKSGLQDEAIAAYSLALRDQPDDADAHNNLGYLLYRKGLTNEAVAHFRRALEVQPDHASARKNLQRALGGQRAPAGQPP